MVTLQQKMILKGLFTITGVVSIISIFFFIYKFDAKTVLISVIWSLAVVFL
jgi:hypothetical protein